MRKFNYLLLMCFVALSCQKKELVGEYELLRKEIHSIDWSTVDEYPSYKGCEELMNDPEKYKTSFFKQLSSDIKGVLFTNERIRKQVSFDTLMLKVVVTPENTIQIETFELTKKSITLKETIDLLLLDLSKKIEPVYAATKRGIPVRTEFVLKIILD